MWTELLDSLHECFSFSPKIPRENLLKVKFTRMWIKYMRSQRSLSRPNIMQSWCRRSSLADCDILSGFESDELWLVERSPHSAPVTAAWSRACEHPSAFILACKITASSRQRGGGRCLLYASLTKMLYFSFLLKKLLINYKNNMHEKLHWRQRICRCICNSSKITEHIYDKIDHFRRKFQMALRLLHLNSSYLAYLIGYPPKINDIVYL